MCRVKNFTPGIAEERCQTTNALPKLELPSFFSSALQTLYVKVFTKVKFCEKVHVYLKRRASGLPEWLGGSVPYATRGLLI